MNEEKEIIRIGRVLNKMLGSGVAIQPNSLLHMSLNYAVAVRKYEVSESELTEVLFKIGVIKDAMWTYCPEYGEVLEVLDEIITALKNE